MKDKEEVAIETIDKELLEVDFINKYMTIILGKSLKPIMIIR